jgi:hypothetical protein
MINMIGENKNFKTIKIEKENSEKKVIQMKFFLGIFKKVVIMKVKFLKKIYKLFIYSIFKTKIFLLFFEKNIVLWFFMENIVFLCVS